MIFILLNILIFIVLISVWFNPNGSFTDFQYFCILFLIYGSVIFAKSLPSVFLIFFCSIFNGILWVIVALSGHLCYDSDKISITIHNESDSISKNDKRLILPFCKCDFSKVTLNPKFVAKYYQLEKLKSKIKPKFSNFVIRTFLQEYFYFKSVYSSYLIKREKHRKVC